MEYIQEKSVSNGSFLGIFQLKSILINSLIIFV